MWATESFLQKENMKSVLNAVLIAAVFATNAVADEKKVEVKSATKPVVTPGDRPVQARPVEAKADAKLDKDKVSYAIGMYFGNIIKRNSLEVDVDTVSKALKDLVGGGTTRLTEQEAQQVMQQMQAELQAKQKEMMAKREAEAKVAGEKNKKEGETFLAENAKKPGVKTLPSGLQYKVITEGKGEKPKASDTVSTHYRGRLINGTEFDSSYKRSQPMEFAVGGVIPGWTEALQLMKVGSKWELYIPSNLAYGERGSPPNIGPDSTLIFEIELLSIKPPTESSQAVSGEIIKVPSAEGLKKGEKIEVIRPDQTNTATPKK